MSADPPLPTDNLYKFMALSGLALYVVSVAWPWAQLQQADRRRIEVRGEMDVLTAEMNALEKEIDSTPQSKAAPLLPAFDRRVLDSKIKLIQITTKHNLIEQIERTIVRLRRFVLAGVTMGGLLSALGFVLW